MITLEKVLLEQLHSKQVTMNEKGFRLNRVSDIYFSLFIYLFSLSAFLLAGYFGKRTQIRILRIRDMQRDYL
jgi:hypothetical protein